MNGSTWRDHPFVIGGKYIALHTNPDFTHGEIVVDKVYELSHIGHSHYDAASVFTFKCLTTGDLVSWWWFDHASDELCETNFKLTT